MLKISVIPSLMAIATLATTMIAQSQDRPRAISNTNSTATFRNPLLPSGPDPWMTEKDGFYYYMNTTGNNLTIWKTRNPLHLDAAEKKVVWTPPSAGPYSQQVWAPELHWLNGRWYIYFGADAEKNETHRIWVVENPNPDPLQGKWTMRGKVADSADKWAIDPSVFEHEGNLYLVWSGWPADENGRQNIYIGRMKDPWTLASDRVLVSTPEYPWEKVGDNNGKLFPGDPPHIDVNEGPEVLEHGGKIFLVYSASACWTDYYSLGMLTASASSNLLDPASWKKSPQPVFQSSAEAHAYAPGHNSFFMWPDAKQDWILYHANSKPNEGCGEHRAPRAQPFTWRKDGTPDFGKPMPTGTPLKDPAGNR